jgi:hypothetical protein
MQPRGRTLLLSLAVLAAGAGCAHAAAAGEPVAEDQPRPVHHRIYVTGSRLPQDVDTRLPRDADLCTGLPGTTENVRVYCRDRIVSTGREHDVGAALRHLDPSISP